jgi:hypothetical protein
MTQFSPPRQLSTTELHNTFFSITPNFDFKIDASALSAAIAYRTSHVPLQNPQTVPPPPKGKIMPLNISEMEKELMERSKHSTFHTDSKLLKEFDVRKLSKSNLIN